MSKLARILTGVAATATLAVTAAAPAQAQYYRDYRHYDRGIDAGDVLTGVAVVGGIAAIASAIGSSNRYDRGYGYGNAYGGYGQGAAVQACAYQAERYGRGRVQILDVDQRGARSFRVHGVIDGNGGYYGRYDQRIGFNCTARDNGRVTRFNTNRY